MKNYIWIIFGIVAIVLLIIFWRKRNAVWGGFTAGIVLGFLVALFFVFRGSIFDWYIIVKGSVLGTMMGFVAELLGKVSDFVKKKKK